jgi:hypothetical protein
MGINFATEFAERTLFRTIRPKLPWLHIPICHQEFLVHHYSFINAVERPVNYLQAYEEQLNIVSKSNNVYKGVHGQKDQSCKKDDR